MKKLILSTTLLLSCFFVSHATVSGGVTWVMGLYTSDIEIWGHCTIFCDYNPQLYCYTVASGAAQQNQNLLNVTPGTTDVPGPSWISFDDLGYTQKQSITIQIYDASQNILKTLYGTYNGMNISYNNDGSSNSDIGFFPSN